MEDYRININYAKALFLTASNTGQLDAVAQDMRFVNQICAENHLLNVVLANPTIREGQKVAILRSIFADKVSQASMLFMTYVVKKRRAINMKGISNAYIELYRKERNIILTKLQTAVEPSEETKEAVRKVVSEYTNMEVELQTEIDEDYLGGYSIEFDNNMYDARLSTQILKLQKKFSKNVYESQL